MEKFDGINKREREPKPIELLELDIDIRLATLWAELGKHEQFTLDIVATFLRAAYGKGYTDAHIETNRGQLFTDHDYVIPPKNLRMPISE